MGTKPGKYRQLSFVDRAVNQHSYFVILSDSAPITTGTIIRADGTERLVQNAGRSFAIAQDDKISSINSS